jgi:hypothetical protein
MVASGVVKAVSKTEEMGDALDEDKEAWVELRSHLIDTYPIDVAWSTSII